MRCGVYISATLHTYYITHTYTHLPLLTLAGASSVVWIGYVSHSHYIPHPENVLSTLLISGIIMSQCIILEFVTFCLLCSFMTHSQDRPVSARIYATTVLTLTRLPMMVSGGGCYSSDMAYQQGSRV